MRHRSLKILISFGVSALLIGALATQLDWIKLKEAFSTIYLPALIPAVLIFAIHYLLRAWRWGAILPEGTQGTLKQRLNSLMVGNLASFILPLRAGEFIRPLLFMRYSGTPFAIGFSSVILERVFDLSAVLLTFGILVLFVNNFPNEIFIFASFIATMGAVLISFFIVGAFFEAQMRSLIKTVLKNFPTALRNLGEKVSNDLLKAAAPLRSLKKLSAMSFLTVAVWASGYLNFQTYFWLLGINPSPLVSITAGVIVALAVAAPSAPGFIGVYQWGWIAALALFGIEAETATAISIVSHAFTYLIFIGYGGYVLLKDNIQLGDLQKRSEDLQT